MQIFLTLPNSLPGNQNMLIHKSWLLLKAKQWGHLPVFALLVVHRVRWHHSPQGRLLVEQRLASGVTTCSRMRPGWGVGGGLSLSLTLSPIQQGSQYLPRLRKYVFCKDSCISWPLFWDKKHASPHSPVVHFSRLGAQVNSSSTGRACGSSQQWGLPLHPWPMNSHPLVQNPLPSGHKVLLPD